MSTFTETAASKMKWADADSDSSDGEEENEEQTAQKQEETVVEPAQEEEEDDSSEESDSDVDDTEKLDLSKVQAAPVVKKEVKQLTKKERKEQKLQELNDLDSLLAEFGTLQPAAADSSTNASTTPLSTAEEGDNDESKKNKKKKKKPTAKKADTTAEKAPEVEGEFVIAADASSILKSRTSGGKKGSSSKAPAVSDAQKIALAEMKKSAEGSKKKRDKSKFCEGTY